MVVVVIVVVVVLVVLVVVLCVVVIDGLTVEGDAVVIGSLTSGGLDVLALILKWTLVLML